MTSTRTSWRASTAIERVDVAHPANRRVAPPTRLFARVSLAASWRSNQGHWLHTSTRYPEPKAKRLPSGDQLTLYVVPLKSRASCRSPVATFQTLTVRSRELLASCVPSGEKATDRTELPWVRFWSTNPVIGSQIFTV